MGFLERLIPGSDALPDTEVIRRSPLFDAEWYGRQAGLSSADDAAAHYLAQGAATGLDPSAHFSTSEYLALNPDVAQTGMNPLLHYERFGRAEGRPCGKAITMSGDYREHRLARGIMRALGRAVHADGIARNDDARVLVLLHVFYASAIPELCQYLENLAPYRPRIIVSYVAGYVCEDDLAPLCSPGNVELRPCENRGYDLAPFFDVLQSVSLDDYDIVFKLHSKSVQNERLSYGMRFAPREWFLRLFDGCIGPFSVHRAIDLLMRDPSCGLVAEQKLLSLKDPPHNQRMVRAALTKRGLPAPEGDYRFVAGTCFAARADALKSLQEAGITQADFAPVSYGIFALAHALERFICTEIVRQGKHLEGIATHRIWAAWSQHIAEARYRKNGHRIRETLDMRFCDEDLLCLNGMFFDSWQQETVEIGALLSRDGKGELMRLGDAKGQLFSKHSVPWTASDELAKWVDEHFMRAGDMSLDSLEEVPWSQAIIVNPDYYIMCGHDVANALLAAHGPDAKVEVVRYI